MKNGGMAIILLNRRGHARSLLCRECGEIMTCPHCAVSLTVHKTPRGNYDLLCHYCHFHQGVPQDCPHCHKKESLKSVGFGIQQAEEELRSLFPHKRLVRMDADTMKGKDAYHDLHDLLHKDQVDILLGTQMLAKGLDHPRVRLVGVLDADIGLAIPDFRAEERTFQLLMQVLGRAGRQGDESSVVIQTWMPESPVIQFATTQDMEGFYNYMIEQRREHHYPPFAELIKCQVRGKTPEAAEEAALQCIETLQKIIDDTKAEATLMHAPAYISRQQGVYVHHVFLKGKNLQELIAKAALPRTVRIDIEPLNLL